uniref:VOC family protein n=1 Tax=Pantoea sp. TaxID=69393 RepID=UPI0028B16A77
MKINHIASTLFASTLLLGMASASAPAFSASASPVVSISGVDHAGINVPDIGKAIAFFQSTFGAQLESDITPGAIPDAWKAAFNWRQSSDLKRFVMMRLPDGTGVELFQYSGEQINHQRPHEDDDAATHIALRTADVLSSYQAIKKAGLKTLNEPVTNADGTQWFYFLTPWGSQIELVGKVKKGTDVNIGTQQVAPSGLQQLIDRHFAIWNNHDAAARAKGFADVYTPDFFVADYDGLFEGAERVTAAINRVQSQHPGFIFTPAPVEWNHGVARVTWGYGPKEDPYRVRGEDVI